MSGSTLLGQESSSPPLTVVRSKNRCSSGVFSGTLEGLDQPSVILLTVGLTSENERTGLELWVSSPPHVGITWGAQGASQVAHVDSFVTLGNLSNLSKPQFLQGMEWKLQLQNLPSRMNLEDRMIICEAQCLSHTRRCPPSLNFWKPIQVPYGDFGLLGYQGAVYRLIIATAFQFSSVAQLCPTL